MSEVDYDGWAPCIHKDEEIPKAIEFVMSVNPEYGEDRNTKYESLQGGILEDMIGQLTDLTGRGDIQVDCDQWWGVFVTGIIYVNGKGQTFTTRVQADTLLLGVAETLRWWSEKYKELRS